MDVQSLTEDLEAVGLTEDQARVYVRLLQTGPTKVRNLTPYFESSRSTVYRLLDELTELGIAKKTPETPAIYEAEPPSHLFEIGEGRLQRSMNRLQAVRERWEEPLETLHADEGDENRHHWKKIEGASRIYDILQTRIGNMDESFAAASNHEISTSFDLPVVDETWQVLLEEVSGSEIECRMLFDLDERTAGQVPDSAVELENVLLRDFSAEETIHFILIDGHEVVMWVRPAPLGRIGKKDDVAVWTNAPGSVFAHRMLFERLWNEAKPLHPV